MVNKIDKEEFKFINIDFIQRTSLRQGPASLDIDGKDSLKHLQNIIESEKPMIKTICLEHDAVKETYRNATNVTINSKRILEYHFIWGRMMLELYYFYHDTQEEALKIIDKMLFYEGVNLIKEAVREGIKLIDDYYEKEWNETIPDTNRINKPQTKVSQSITQQQTTLKQNPDVLQLMQDINSGKIRYCDVDWESEIKALLVLRKIMPTKFPYVLMLWGFLGEISDPTTRMSIIGKLQDAAPKCFESRTESQKFIDDCACIYHICLLLREYNNRNDIGIRHWWTDDRKCLNDLAHVFSDKTVDAKEMVAFAEEMYKTSQSGVNQHMITLVLHANRNIGKLTINNIVDFAKNLYIAEGFRKLILSGQDDYMDIPALEDFNPKLLKACFEEYIRLRSLQIKEIIERDLTHYGDAEDLECWEYLLQDENQYVNRENMLEDFHSSSAYHALWYQGKPKVLEMINVFTKYLQNKIKTKKKEAAKQGGLHIEHVENFAMGDNVQNKYMNSND